MQSANLIALRRSATRASGEPARTAQTHSAISDGHTQRFEAMTPAKDLQPLSTAAASDSSAEFGTNTIRCPHRHSCDQDLIQDCDESMTTGFDQCCPQQIAHAFADGVRTDLIGAIEDMAEQV